MTLAILVIIALAWGFWMWKQPAQAFAFLPLALPTYVIRTSIGPLPTTMLELIIGATVIGWMLHEVRGQEGWIAGMTKRIKSGWEVFRPWKWVAGCWLLAGFISIFVSPNHLAAIGLYRAYFIEPLLIFFIGGEVLRNNQKTKFQLTDLLAIAVIILGLWSIIQMTTGWGIPDPWNFVPGRRAVGPFPFPNALALFVTPIAAFLFADLIRGWKKKGEACTWIVTPWLSIPGYLLSLASIILAASDGGLIALGAASFLVLVFNRRTRLLGISLAILGTIFIASIAPLRERVTTVIMFREWSSKVRIVMWQETLMMLKDHKIMGAGLGGYPFVIRVYHRSGDWMEVFQYPHNVILNLWSEIGLFGLFVFGWILVKWGAGKKKPRIEHAILVAPIIVAILVHGLVDVPYFKNDLAILFWLLILVTMHGGNKSAEKPSDVLTS